MRWRIWKSPWHEEGRNLLQGHASPALLLSPASLRARLLGAISSATILGPKTACFPRCYIELFVSRARRRRKCRRCVPGPPSPAGEGPDSGRKALTKRLLPKSGSLVHGKIENRRFNHWKIKVFRCFRWPLRMLIICYWMRMTGFQERNYA